MRGFDVLDPTLDLKKSYFLEASAGSGKTFTLENIVVRLLEEGIPVEKILIVTFTRAASLELKLRIRRRLEEKQNRAILANFDEAQIFTIHGFCFHILKEHAFETGFSLTQEREGASPEASYQILKDFLRTGLPADEIHPRQLKKALKNGMEGLLKKLSKPSQKVGRCYREIREDIRRAVQAISWRPSLDELMEMTGSFKKFGEPEEIEEGFRRTIRLFSDQSDDAVDLPLRYMIPGQLKLKKKYPSPLEVCCERLIPLLDEASDPDLILGRLSQRASQFLQTACEKEDLFFYDDLINLMQKSVRNPQFAAKVRALYEAVLIDEFQDTDQVQWEIFSTLFLHHRPLYVVGDPKQSIYRFRGADLYTYIRAKEALGEEAYTTLTRNYRSQPSLIEALNTLFHRAGTLITLPKIGQAIPIYPMVAALQPSHEGKVTFCEAEDEKALFIWTFAEIERLHREEGIAYRECAVLVKDRYQTQRFCEQCPLPVVTRKSASLLESDALAVLEDLLQAVLSPRDKKRVFKVLGGPLFNYPLNELTQGLEAEPLHRYHQLLLTKGILPFFQKVVEEAFFSSQALYDDLWQLVEIIAENTTGAEEALPFLQKLKQEDPEADFLKTRAKDEDAIQVMTLHVSKGLEFEAVFPVGLALKAEMEEEEDVSEKMRQLYVAFTRAKRHLYLPILPQVESPLHFFLQKVLKGESLDSFVQDHLHFALASCAGAAPPLFEPPPPPPSPPSPTYHLSFPPAALHSYSSLAPPPTYEGAEQVAQGHIPAGIETGILLHRLLEKCDFTLQRESLRSFVQAELRNSLLEPWSDAISDLLHNAFYARLAGPQGPFCLADVEPGKMFREMEFLYPSTQPPGFLKGFIDLFFEYRGDYYCLDWKSNVLPEYSEGSLKEAIQAHHYDLQAQIYHTAARKYLKLFGQEEHFVGSFFLFLRGLQPHETIGVHSFD